VNEKNIVKIGSAEREKGCGFVESDKKQERRLWRGIIVEKKAASESVY
jgi:hypothetical protein